MSIYKEGYIHAIETMGCLDGPGIRFILFMQGCNLRCAYCHNVDSQAKNCGRKMNTNEVAKEVLKYKEFFISSNGGITVSGGEPLLQIHFLIELFKILKKENIHTAVDTSGDFKLNEKTRPIFDELLAFTDLILLDIKLIDEERHIKLTGFTNKHILELGKYISEKGIPIWIRHVLVPNITNKKGDLQKLKNYIDELKTVTKIEVLPYHNMGKSKWEELGLDFPLKGVKAPTEEEVKEARDVLQV